MTSRDRASRSVFVALILVAFNLRTPITSLPTVVTDIEATTGLDKAAIGMLTTLPILMMGLLAFAVPSIASRFGLTRVVWFAVAILGMASALRLAGAYPGALFASAALAGAAIALAGGCVPAIVRQQLPHQIGLVTGLWITAMMLGAALAAAFTVPLTHALGSWQTALAFWAVPAVLAWAVWTVVERRERLAAPPVRSRTSLRDLPWRGRTAWALTAFLAVNAVLYYTTVAWLAPSLAARGLSQAASGAAFGLAAAVGFVSALIFPVWLQRTRYPRALLVSAVIGSVIASVGIALYPLNGTAVWMILFGIFNTAWFTMGQALIGMLSSSAERAAGLTAMVYAGTYLLAAVGPVSAGAFLELTGAWSTLFLALAALCVLALVTIPPLRPGGAKAH